jgi:hypothetical protein
VAFNLGYYGVEKFLGQLHFENNRPSKISSAFPNASAGNNPGSGIDFQAKAIIG